MEPVPDGHLITIINGAVVKLRPVAAAGYNSTQRYFSAKSCMTAIWQASRTAQGCNDDGVRRGSEARGKILANFVVAGLLDLYRTFILLSL
jgi:hypothetical protein